MTYLQIQTRYSYLKGESDVTALTATDKSHINAMVQDVVNTYPFSWDTKSANLTLTAGASNLPTDLNYPFSVQDARITGTGQFSDKVFLQIPIEQKNNYSSADYVYWITYDSTNSVYVFNTNTLTGTVAIRYYFTPADMSGDSDVCVVPDGELIAYGAASKNWIGDERNIELKQDYEKEAQSRIQSLYAQDLQFGPDLVQGSQAELEPQLNHVYPEDLRINY